MNTELKIAFWNIVTHWEEHTECATERFQWSSNVFYTGFNVCVSYFCGIVCFSFFLSLFLFFAYTASMHAICCWLLAHSMSGAWCACVSVSVQYTEIEHAYTLTYTRLSNDDSPSLALSLSLWRWLFGKINMNVRHVLCSATQTVGSNCSIHIFFPFFPFCAYTISIPCVWALVCVLVV